MFGVHKVGMKRRNYCNYCFNFVLIILLFQFVFLSLSVQFRAFVSSPSFKAFDSAITIDIEVTNTQMTHRSIHH